MITDDTSKDLNPIQPGHKKKYEQVVDTPDATMCRLGDTMYPEGSVQIIDGRPATCTAGHWLSDGDDPPFRPKRVPDGLNLDETD